MFGTAGLPHILMRFYTVPDAEAARSLGVLGDDLIGVFYLITFILGFGAMVLVGHDAIIGGRRAAATWRRRCSPRRSAARRSSASSAPSPSPRSSRSSPASRSSGAAALSHDLWVNVVQARACAGARAAPGRARRDGHPRRSARSLLGIVFKGQNVAYMVGLAFAIAATANFPALVLSIFWRRFTTWGAVRASFVGTVSTLVLIYAAPTIQVDILKHDLAEVSKQWWYFPLKNPCLITMTLSFLSGILVSLLKPEPAAEAGFAEVERRAILGAIPDLGPAAAKAAPAE